MKQASHVDPRIDAFIDAYRQTVDSPSFHARTSGKGFTVTKAGGVVRGVYTAHNLSKFMAQDLAQALRVVLGPIKHLSCQITHTDWFEVTGLAKLSNQPLTEMALAVKGAK